MKRCLLCLLPLMFVGSPFNVILHAQDNQPTVSTDGQSPNPTPIFHFPIVPDAEISGYFDHDPAEQSIAFYDGRNSVGAHGFAFSCAAVGGAWVGCADAAAGEAACGDARELWYDNHHGIDFEYSPEWRTGESCDLNRFGGISLLVEAPAAGLVDFVGEGDP